MFFSFFSRRGKGRPEAENAAMRLVRLTFAALVFGAVAWGFWINSERHMGMVKKPVAEAFDFGSLLDARQEEQLAEYRDRFREAYGLNLRLRVSREALPEPFLAPEERAGTLFLGLCPSARQVILELPPLAEAALGRDTVLYLRREHFLPYFTAGSWPEGLAGSLNMLTLRFDAALLRPQETPGP